MRQRKRHAFWWTPDVVSVKVNKCSKTRKFFEFFSWTAERPGKIENVMEKVMESHGIWRAQTSTNPEILGGKDGGAYQAICRFISCMLRVCAGISRHHVLRFFLTIVYFQGSTNFKKMKLMEKERSVKRRYGVKMTFCVKYLL